MTLPGLQTGLLEAGNPQLVREEVPLDAARRLQHAKLLEERLQGDAHLLIWVLNDAAVGEPAVADRQTLGERAAAGFVEQTAAHPSSDDVEFGGEEGPFQTEHQAIVRVARVVEAIFISDERPEHGAQLDDPVPIAIQSRKARHFGDQHDADLAQADRGHQALKAVARRAAGA